jgi:hypothetical protein
VLAKSGGINIVLTLNEKLQCGLSRPTNRAQIFFAIIDNYASGIGKLIS